MVAKKDDKSYNKSLEEIENRVNQKLIAKYPELQYEIGLEYGSVPKKYEKERQSMIDEEIKKLDQKTDLIKTSENEKFETQLEEKTQKIEELTDTLKRLQAEFENFKKRTEKEKAEFMGYANAGIIANLLPVIDTFEIAFKNTNDKDKFIEGMKMVYAQLHTLLEAEGLKPIRALGEKFDPYKHEVLLKEQSEKPEDTILEEFQKGYMLNDKVIRHSKVKISGK